MSISLLLMKLLKFSFLLVLGWERSSSKLNTKKTKQTKTVPLQTLILALTLYILGFFFNERSQPPLRVVGCGAGRAPSGAGRPRRGLQVPACRGARRMRAGPGLSGKLFVPASTSCSALRAPLLRSAPRRPPRRSNFCTLCSLIPCSCPRSWKGTDGSGEGKKKKKKIRRHRQ